MEINNSKDFWQKRIAEQKKIAEDHGECGHWTKSVQVAYVECLICGEVLATTQEEARKYYAGAKQEEA